MQKTIGTTKGIRDSKGGIYPPWSLMLAHIFVNGVFSLRIWPLGGENARKGV
jgi:hypothetical protein